MDHINSEIAFLKTKVDRILTQQEEITKLLAENNILLRRNMGLFDITQTRFPIESEDSLQILDNDLATEQKMDIVGVIKRILTGSLKNIDKILSKNIIMNFNYDGTKTKKSLKVYGNVLNGLFEATKNEGDTYERFVKELRAILHRVKNTNNKANSRKTNKENSPSK